MSNYKRPQTRKAVQRYRELHAMQRSMPPDKQWTMGADLRNAKANALLEIECERLGV